MKLQLQRAHTTIEKDTPLLGVELLLLDSANSIAEKALFETGARIYSAPGEKTYFRPVGTGGLGEGGGWRGWSPPPNNCETVVCSLYNSVLNEKENTGQPPNMNFGGTAFCC